MPAVIRAVLADDEELMHLAVGALLGGMRGYVLTASVDSIGAAERLVHRTLPDLLICEADIRGESGVGLHAHAPSPEAQLMEQFGLSRREREVLAEVLSGSGNKMIAGRLHISEDTVMSHMKAIFRKLGARDRAHAVALALGRAPLASADPAAPWGPGL